MSNKSFSLPALLLIAVLLVVSPFACAQSFGNLFRQAAQKATQHAVQKTIEKAAENKQDKKKQPGRDKQLEKQMDAMIHPGASKEVQEDEAPTIRLPKQHTALFEPLGYPIEDHFGTLSVKQPVFPPKKAADQVDWVGKQPSVLDMDNQSLVDEYLMLDKAESKGISMDLSPAYHRYHALKDVIYDRCEVLNAFVRWYNEVKGEYAMGDDTYNWVINGDHRRMVDLIGGDTYKALIRSSLVPLFTQTPWIDEDTRAYFAAHGGYENAHKAQWTRWDPEPNKQTISTSDSGKAGKVLHSNASGAHVDVEGITYILHNDGQWAFMSALATAVVAGKDIVIPDYINYNGKKYMVTSMRGDLFAKTAIKSVKIPACMDEIPNGAFACTPITEIVIPATVKVIQGSAFRDCKNLSRVVFEGDRIDAVHGCFQRCTKLQSVVFPKSIKEGMSYDMFSGCTALTSVTLPQNLRVLPERFFEGCKKLTSIELPASVKQVGEDAFDHCTGLVSVSLPGVTDLGEGAFSGCTALKTVKITSAVEAKLKADNYWGYVVTFDECPNLQLQLSGDTISLPAGIVVMDRK
ncbi:MAG TPA: hypothetical protein DIW30_01315 [Bacteroidales bacterium]|nr:hypothetical protein [Bacteroidales bacterium]